MSLGARAKVIGFALNPKNKFDLKTPTETTGGADYAGVVFDSTVLLTSFSDVALRVRADFLEQGCNKRIADVMATNMVEYAAQGLATAIANGNA